MRELSAFIGSGPVINAINDILRQFLLATLFQCVQNKLNILTSLHCMDEGIMVKCQTTHHTRLNNLRKRQQAIESWHVRLQNQQFKAWLYNQRTYNLSSRRWILSNQG